MNTPSDDELRVMVAKEIGWKQLDDSTRIYAELNRGFYYAIKPDGQPTYGIPNYPEDLNACAGFEQTLTTQDKYDYFVFLRGIMEEHIAQFVIFATARQRCVAFLMTRGEIK